MTVKRDRLAQRRASLGFSQETLAERLNVDPRTVRRWESGESVSGPQPWLRPKLARCLQVSPEQLEELLLGDAVPEPADVELVEVPAGQAPTELPGGVLLPMVLDGRPVLVPIDTKTLAANGISIALSRLVDLNGEESSAAASSTEWGAMSPFSRRSFLKHSLAVSALPALDLDELQRVAAALDNARRYFDGSVVDFFKRQLALCKADDGVLGTNRTLPTVLGILGAIKENAREVAPEVRRELLTLGAEGAEFAGWLYRDARDVPRALFWHDRAIEWAQVVGDTTMQGYVLLKKAQLAYDERDAETMLGLAQAVRTGPWLLPKRVQAEAVQQEARAEAMLGASLDTVERELDEARHLLGASRSEECKLGAHYNDTLLTMQTAICYSEAGKPQRAVDLYEQSLKENSFSPRDYGFFLSWMAASLALAGEPDEAARTGMESAKRATNASSQRTRKELARVVEVLAPWQNRPAVKELQASIQ